MKMRCAATVVGSLYLNFACDLTSISYVHKVDMQGTRHLPPPRRPTRQLLSGRGGCTRGKPPAM